MSKKHQLIIGDDDCVDSIYLLAIYSDELDYRMAYLINYYLNLKLERVNSIVDNKRNLDFTLFEYQDKMLYTTYHLVSNYHILEKKTSVDSDVLPGLETIEYQKIFLIKQFSKASFLLIINGELKLQEKEKFLNNLKNIPQIYTTEFIDLDAIKNLKILKKIGL